VGKSTLIEAFLAERAGQAMILRGRCLPYGRGITFWPLVEIMRSATGVPRATTSMRRATG